MKTIDFSFLKNSRLLSVLSCGLLAFCAINATAGQSQPENFDQPTELILTLSDQTLVDADQGANRLLSQSAKSNVNLQQAEKRKTRPVNLGCGVDVNQFPGEDNSLPSRLVGECNLDYRY